VLRRLPAAAAILALVAACSTGDAVTEQAADADVVVASFDFAESQVVAEIYALALEDEGLSVRRELSLGPRELVLPALRAGLVDLVPEYTGSSLRAVAPDGPLPEGPAAVAQLRAALAPWGLVALSPAPASNQNAFAVRRELAADRSLRDLSDLAPLAGQLVLGGPAECVQRPLCLPGLRETYGLRFADFVPLEGAAQVAQAMADGVIDVGVLFSTDPVLARGALVALGDDRGLQPAEDVVPVVRAATLADRRVEEVLAEVSAALTTEALRFLNWRVAEAGTTLTDEARGWLHRQGIVER
jgi:osmoprotectant transport system substrate-binding protein